MEKILNIYGKELPAKSTAGSLFKYKLNFGRDGLQDLTQMVKNIPNNATDTDLLALIADGKLELDTLYRFIWVFCKTADPSIKPLVEWLDEFGITPFEFMQEAFPQIQDLLYSNIRTSVKSKNV